MDTDIEGAESSLPSNMVHTADVLSLHVATRTSRVWPTVLSMAVSVFWHLGLLT